MATVHGTRLIICGSLARCSTSVDAPLSHDGCMLRLLCAHAATYVSGATVNVTCSKPDDGWPKNSFTVGVMVSGGAAGCIGSSSNFTTVYTNIKPTITVTPRTGGPVCSTADTKVVTFDLSGAGSDYTIDSVTSPGVNCSAGPVTAGVWLCSIVFFLTSLIKPQP